MTLYIYPINIYIYIYYPIVRLRNVEFWSDIRFEFVRFLFLHINWSIFSNSYTYVIDVEKTVFSE